MAKDVILRRGDGRGGIPGGIHVDPLIDVQSTPGLDTGCSD